MRRASNLREQEKRSSRDIVLKAAIDEFAEYGLSGGRVDRIAKRAKLNKQALYYYFENKEALFAAALIYGYTHFQIDKPDWTQTPSPIDAMKAYVAATFNMVQENKSHAALIVSRRVRVG